MDSVNQTNINEASNSLEESRLHNKVILNDYVLTEKDFYPPEDKRIYRSGVSDIVDGDNFEEYAKWFYDNYEDELFDS